MSQPTPSFRGRDVDYEVEVSGGKVDRVRRVDFVGGTATPVELEKRPCFEIVCGRRSSCVECPAQAVATLPVGAERTAICHTAGNYEISTAVHAEPFLVRVRLRHLRGDHLRDAQTARIAQLSRDATLSPRERQVLEQLLHGASSDDIASKLGISPRTVKFHQTNLLNKLGADSRVDLLRILA